MVSSEQYTIKGLAIAGLFQFDNFWGFGSMWAMQKNLAFMVMEMRMSLKKAEVLRR